MKKAFERIYAASGLFLIVLSLINFFTGVGDMNSVYVLMCVGLFIFFDSLNYFFIDQEALLSGKISLLSSSLFIIFLRGYNHVLCRSLWCGVDRSASRNDFYGAD